MALYTFHLVVIEPPADLFTSPATTSSAFEKDVFSRQMSVHFGSTSFLRRSIVPTSRSYADSSGGATPPAAEQLLRWESAYDNNPFLLHVAVHSGLQRVKAEVPFPPIPSTPWPR